MPVVLLFGRFEKNRGSDSSSFYIPQNMISMALWESVLLSINENKMNQV